MCSGGVINRCQKVGSLPLANYCHALHGGSGGIWPTRYLTPPQLIDFKRHDEWKIRFEQLFVRPG